MTNNQYITDYINPLSDSVINLQEMKGFLPTELE